MPPARAWAPVAIPVALLGLFRLLLPFELQDTRASSAEAECRALASTSAGTNRITSLERCSIVEPANLDVLADLADTYERASRFDDARKTYRRMLALDASDAQAHLRLGVLLALAGLTDEASRELRTALEIAPNNTEATAELERLSDHRSDPSS